MPVIETTMIAGYGPEVKKRLVTAFTRGVRSVMAAPLDGVVVVLREVDPSCWARGGVSRIPGPALPDPLEIVAQAAAAGDAGGDPANPSPPAAYAALTEAYTDDGSLVFAEGVLPDGAPVMDRYLVRAGKIVEVSRWTRQAPSPAAAQA